MIIYFAVGPDNVYNEILSEEGVDDRLMSFFYLDKLSEFEFVNFIKTGYFAATPSHRRRKKKRSTLNVEDGLFKNT